jgi:integrase
MAQNNKRRGYGEGSIFQRADRRWTGTIDLGFAGGKRRRKSVYGKSKREVQVKLAAARRKADDNNPLPNERLTLAAYLRQWVADIGQRVRPHTQSWYGDMLRLHIIPGLGQRPLARLSAAEIEAFYTKKLETLSPRSVGHLHRILHKALQDALRLGRVAHNPCAAVQPPSVPRKEVQALSPEEARQLLAAAAGDPLEALYILAVTCGLRQSELLALRWPDVDFERGKLRVQRGLRRLKGGGWVEREPKSATSRRVVTLTPLALDALRRHRAQQVERRLAALAWDESWDGLVFSNEVGRPIEASNLLRRSYFPLLERAGLRRVKFHALRHSAASLLLVQGVHPRVVAEMLGHSSVSLTLNTYSHLVADLQTEAAAAMQSLLTGTAK